MPHRRCVSAPFGGEVLPDFVARREPGAVTAALNEVAEELAAEHRSFDTEAARRTLERSEW